MRRLLRLSGTIRRKFSGLPHWVHDIYGLLSYVNFVELLPTVAAIAMAPRHFFRRLPQTMAGQRSHFQTPVKFFANFAALFLAVFFVRHGDWTQLSEEGISFWYLAALIPMTPLAMYGLGIVSWVLYQVPRLSPNGDAFPPPNGGAFKLLLNPVTYLNLDPVKFLWGLFYISVYFVAVWQLVQVLVALDFLGVVYLVNALGDGHIAVKGIMILMGLAIVALSVHGFVLHPYMELLRAALRRPTVNVFESDVHQVRQMVREFLALPKDHDALDAHADVLHGEIQREMSRLCKLMVQQDLDHRLDATQCDQRMLVHRSAFQLEALREQLSHVTPFVRQKFEKLWTRFQPDSVQAETRRAA
ncbi:MAG: hypothetical protein AAF989_11270 [Planctomycetota bacterium]